MSRDRYAPSRICTRGQHTDVFQNDPFKIQSYNFRYADRPVYEVQHYQRVQLPQSKPSTFETYYRNPKFIAKNVGCKAAPAASSFADLRRRMLLHDFKCTSTAPNKVHDVMGAAEVRPKFCRKPSAHPAVPDSPLLRTCCNRAEYKTMPRGQSISTLKKDISSSNVQRRESGSASKEEPQRNPSTSTFKLSPQRSDSSCSGCAINININGLESEADLNNRLRIKINTDSCLDNNTENCQVHKSHTAQIGSSESFVIDKRLSKLNISAAQKGRCERDLLIAKRELARSERERLEKACQEELQREQQRMRMREQEREHFRQLERERDRERLLELEAERERQRLHELELQTLREREEERLCQYREYSLPMRAMTMPTPVAAPVVMTSHLYRPTSTDRLPGMVPCYVHQSTAKRLPNSTRNVKPQIGAEREQPSGAPSRPTRTVERRSSGSSNYNASVRGCGSDCSLRQLSATRLNERKLLNVHVNGLPVSANQPIQTRLNNVPIRITTSQPVDEDLQFSFNKVRVRNASPAARTTADAAGRSSCGSNRSRLDESVSMPYNVNINVYADDLRTIRL